MENFKVYTSPNFMEIRTMTTDDGFWVAGIDAAVALDLNEVWNVLDNCISEKHKKRIPVDNLGKTVHVEFVDDVGLNVMMQLTKTSRGMECRNWMLSSMVPELKRKKDKLTTSAEQENRITFHEGEIEHFSDDQFGEQRYVKLDSKLWFFGVDVARNIGYAKTWASGSIKSRVQKEDVCKAYISNPCKCPYGFTLITLDGLRTFLHASEKPKAQDYLKWVMEHLLDKTKDDVLNNSQNQNETSELENSVSVSLEKMIESPDFGIRLLTELKNERKKCRDLQLENQKLNEKVKEDPQAGAKSTTGKPIGISISRFVPVLNYNKIPVSTNCLYACLRNNGYLIADGKERNLPTPYSMRLGIMATKMNPCGSNMITLITPKGQKYFVHMFKSRKLEIPCL